MRLMSPPRPNKFTPYFPKEEYLKWYKWHVRQDTDEITTLISFQGQDIMLILSNEMVPTLLHPRETDAYTLLDPASDELLDRVKLWSASGFYRSVHLREFLNNI